MERDNIIRIADKDKIESYVNSILYRINPNTYNKFGCIKLQVTEKYLETADYLIRRWKFAGLIEVERKKKEIKVINQMGKVIF